MPVKGLTKDEIAAATAAVVAAGGKSTDRTNRLPGETATEANARITAAYKAQPKPELTQEGKAAGATMEFVRTGAGGVGTYKEIFPIGASIPTQRTTEYGNVYDTQGNLVSGTGLKTGVPGTATAQGTVTAPGTVTATPTGTDKPITDISKLSKNTLDVIEANAKAQGITAAQYLASRGGVYASGYYGDTPEFRRLSDSEYFAAAKAGGAGAINAALTAKKRAAYIADPSLIEDPRLRLAFQNGRLTIDELLNAELPGSATASQKTFEQIGAMADGTPIYGYDSKGKPVTSPTGSIYSTTSSSDAITNFNSGSSPLSFSSSTTATGVPRTDENKLERISAYNLLYDEFDKYGLGTLVSDIKNILVEGSLDPAEFSLKVRGTDAYKARFIANEARLAKGLKALSPASYIALEDQYQEVMRQYGLPESYYAKTGTGVQEGFRKLIENDVSNIELEDRISTAQKRVINANPEVTQAIKQFYPDITNADILAYTLDPKNAIENIKRKVTTAEIGGAAIQSGLQTGLTRAEQLQAAGVTKDTAQQGYGTIAGGLQRGSQLAAIYGEDPYTQTTAETEVFKIAGAQEARKQRQKITGLEKATFGGQTGISSGALTRDRAGGY
jgi:hypothetical protein